MGRENVKVTAIYSTYSVVYTQELSVDLPYRSRLRPLPATNWVKIPLPVNVNPDLVSSASIRYPRTDHFIRDRRTLTSHRSTIALDAVDTHCAPPPHSRILGAIALPRLWPRAMPAPKTKKPFRTPVPAAHLTVPELGAAHAPQASGTGPEKLHPAKLIAIVTARTSVLPFETDIYFALFKNLIIQIRQDGDTRPGLHAFAQSAS